MKKLSALTILACLMTMTLGFGIEGKWEVQSLANNQQPQEHRIVCSVQDFIFRNESIRWYLEFEGCYHIKYQMEVWEDHLYIDASTIHVDTTKEDQCSREQISREREMGRLIKRSFRFQIVSKYMIFSDLAGEVLIKFQRYSEKQTPDLSGNWKIERVFSSKTSQLLEINENTFTFCQGKGTLKFEKASKDNIEVKQINAEQCDSQELIKAMSQMHYYRKIGDSLTFYSKDIAPIIVTRFYLSLQEYEAVKEEQKRLQEQQQQRRLELAQAERQRILRERQSAQQARQEELNRQVQIAAKPELTNTAADLQGKWKVSKIFGIPTILQIFDFIITEEQMVLSGGCNTHIADYTVQQSGSVELGSVRSTKKLCENDEDGLYVRGMSRITGYSVSIDGDQVVAELNDDRNKLMLQIRKSAEETIVSLSPQPQSTSASPSSSQIEIPSGRYMLLLLKQRNLPRKFVNITSQKFSFQVCNKLTFSMSYSSNSALKLSLQEKTGADPSCDVTQEQTYIDFLTQTATFALKGDDAMLKDENEMEIINLDLIG